MRWAAALGAKRGTGAAGRNRKVGLSSGDVAAAVVLMPPPLVIANTPRPGQPTRGLAGRRVPARSEAYSELGDGRL